MENKMIKIIYANGVSLKNLVKDLNECKINEITRVINHDVFTTVEANLK